MLHMEPEASKELMGDNLLQIQHPVTHLSLVTQ